MSGFALTFDHNHLFLFSYINSALINQSDGAIHPQAIKYKTKPNALSTGYKFFPRLTPATCFPAVGTRYMFPALGSRPMLTRA